MQPTEDAMSAANSVSPEFSKKWTFTAIVSFVSICLFIISEVAILAGATVWSFSGLLNLSPVTSIILGVIVGVPSLYVCYKTVRLAFQAEADSDD